MLEPLAQILDHAARAVARLATQFSESTLLRGMISAFGDEIQELEDGLYGILVSRDLNLAETDALDKLGLLVGATARGNKTDTQYRNRVRAQILANRSSGSATTVYAIAKKLIASWDVTGQPRILEDHTGAPGYTIGPNPPGTIVNVTADARDLGHILDDVNPAGVRGIVLSQSIAGADAFSFANGPGKGFGEGAFVGAYDSGVKN